MENAGYKLPLKDDPYQASKKRIVILDDEPMFPYLIKELIQDDHGFEISEITATPEAFLDYVERNHFDVALIDISVGDREGGIRLLESLKKKGIKLPSIILSAHSEMDYGLKCLETGAKGYINKSYICSSLVEGLRQVCRGRLFVTGEHGAVIVRQFEKANTDVSFN